MLEPVIHNSAKKHGISDENIRHAFHHFIRQVDETNEIEIVIGPDLYGNLMEIGYVVKDTKVIIIHSMKARHKFLRNL